MAVYMKAVLKCDHCPRTLRALVSSDGSAILASLADEGSQDTIDGWAFEGGESLRFVDLQHTCGACRVPGGA